MEKGRHGAMSAGKETGNMIQQTTQRGTDIKLFGALFLLVGLIDVLIIEFFPAYALKLFGVTIAGPMAYVVKLHSPAVHFLIGYGFIFLRPWSWGLAMAYGGFGLTSELMNQVQFGFHQLRTGFMVSTALFLCYVAWRRILFVDPAPPATRLASSSPEVRL
jgi:hypothetical protein